MYNLRKNRNRDESHCPSQSDARREMNFNFEFEAAETLACLANSYRLLENDDEKQLRRGANGGLDHGGPSRVNLPVEEVSTVKKTRPYPGRKVVHQFYHPTSDETARPVTDREAKRWRRVLANRVSARETILRRQNEVDELVKKGKTLELENENLKKQKEEKMRHYQTLKETNDNLKEKMAEFNTPLKPKPEPETAPEPEPEPEPTAAQLFPPHPMHMPSSWHSLIQSSLQQFRSQNATPPVHCRYSNHGTCSSSVPNPRGGAFLHVLKLAPDQSSPQMNEKHSESSTSSNSRGNQGKTVSDVVDKSSGTGGVNVNLELNCYREEAAASTVADPAPPIGCLVDVGTPAQARKRRRELMNLKKLRLGPFTMN